MSRIIAVANQKGGVGKTTTAINVTATLGELGKKVLAVDMDPQGNMTSGLGLDKNEVERSTYDILCGNASIEDCIQKEAQKNLDVLPGNINLSAIELELTDVDNREFILKLEVEKIREHYDYIIIDCPPALNLLTINALTTANSVLVPIQSEYYALEGLTQLIHTIELVKDRLNPELEIDGIVFTMYDARTKLSYQVVKNVKENIGYKVYNTIIPRNVRLAEAPSHGLPINSYDPKSTGAKKYKKLAKEIIKGEN
jgi:chromosome partitioning protein